MMQVTKEIVLLIPIASCSSAHIIHWDGNFGGIAQSTKRLGIEEDLMEFLVPVM